MSLTGWCEPFIQVVDFTYPTSPVTFDLRPILCRGYKCDCREFVRWRTVGGYVECQCGDSEQTHKPKAEKPKKVRR
jgi:hypothetical protein